MPDGRVIKMDENKTQVQVKAAGSLVGGLYDIADVIVSAVAVIFVVFVFLFRLAGVDGASMEPTLHSGDWLAVSSRAYEPQAGDIVIVTQPNSFHKPIVKRIIATEGQTVSVDFLRGTVTVDGKVLDEPYIREPATDPTENDLIYPVTVPQGCVFVMGDNRNESTDSRSSLVGFIDERYIFGNVIFRIFPPGKVG